MKYYKHNDEKSGSKQCCFGIVYKNDLYYKYTLTMYKNKRTIQPYK